MKFFLFLVVCMLGAALAYPPMTREKRDILPGDPRYGTDYHHNHHHEHQHHENEVEVSRALGGYVGSYTVPDNSAHQNTINLQLPQTGYGPPNYTPGKPIHTSYPEVQTQVQKTVHHQQNVQIPSYSQQQSSISNFKPYDNVETISNGYLSPVVEVSQTPAVQYSTPAPTYQQTHQATPLNNDYLAPVIESANRQSAQHPVDSYGTPAITDYKIPEVQPVQPTVQKEHYDDVVEVKSQAVASSESTSNSEHVSPTSVPHEVQNVQDTQVHVNAHAHSDAHSHVGVQPEIHTVKTVQEPVNHHVHHNVVPSVQHTVVKQTVQPPYQHQHQHQQQHQHQIVKQRVQPAVHHRVVYQTVPSSQTYSNGYFGSSTGSINEFSNFDSLNSGFPTYGTPNFQVSTGNSPQYYNSGTSNVGFGFPQDFSSNVNSEHSFETSHVHQPVQSFEHHVRTQLPQTYQVDVTRSVEYPLTIPQIVQNPVHVTSFVQNQVPQYPSYQESSQVIQHPVQPDVQVSSNAYSGVKSYSEPTQPIGTNGGYVY